MSSVTDSTSRPTDLPTSFPRQQLSRSKKTEDWGRQNVDFIINLASANSSRYNSYSKKKINYDLYNNIIDEKDFTYVTNPYGLNEKFPARLQNYSIITSRLKLLEGEEIKRPFNFRIVAVNEEAVSQIEEKRKDMLLQHLESELVSSLQGQQYNIQNPEQAPPTPEQVQEYATYSMNDIREVTANRLAQYLIKEQNLEYKFNKGFKDNLITAEEFYYVGIENGKPIVDVINPLEFDCDRNPDLDFIQDGQWAVHTKYCTPSQIIDAYNRDLSDKEISRIDQFNNGGMGALGMNTGITNNPDIVLPFTSDTFRNSNTNDTTYITVSRVEWKSMRKIGYLTYYDPETLEKLETIVDETYEVVKENGEEVEWIWINEVWEGTRIGNDIYVCVKPKTVQYRSIDNPSICKLGYLGAISNGRNSPPTSLIDLVKPYQYLINILMYRMELEIAKAKGKKFVMDIAQIPRSQGMDIDKWLYYFDNVGIAWVNSFEEGKGKFEGQTSTFNQFSQIDMTLSQSINQYVQLMDKIETMASDLIGVTRQRMGAISSTETVGGVERSVQQSSHVTEPIFYIHNEVKKNVLTQLIECAKVAYSEGKKINYILDDMGRNIINLDEEFINADYGIFVSNSAKEVKQLEDLKMLAQQAISSGMITLKEAATVLTSQSIAQVDNIIAQAEIKADQIRQQEQQAQQQLEQQKAAAIKDLETFKADRLDQRAYIEGDIKKEIAEISALGYAKDTDVNDNGVPDVLESQKLAIDVAKHRDNMAIEKQKLGLEKDKIKSNEEIAKEKNSIEKIKARKPASK